MDTIDFSDLSSSFGGQKAFLQRREGSLLLRKLMVLLFCVNVVATVAQQPGAGTDTARRRFVPPPVGTITPTRETPVHDPVMIKEKGYYGTAGLRNDEITAQ
ncbi:MAG TPA: hypothetical protein VFN95_13210 [Flavitalea sp.]|nr:hypothetical protein [Flavitalea sp.]